MDPSKEKVSETGERKYQVFISSTFLDLAEQRQMVLDVVVDRGHMPIALERFPATDRSVPYVIQKAIEACQIYVVILGYRYGAIVSGTDISFSQLEYEIAYHQKKIVVPFLLVDDEVRNARSGLSAEVEQLKIRAAKLDRTTLDYKELEKRIADSESELRNETKLWEFRKVVKENRYCKEFSNEKGSYKFGQRIRQFSEYMALNALIAAEKEAVEERVSGWIREPEERKLAETLEAVSKNRFLADVVTAMAKFDPLDPRIRDQADEKEAAALFFADKYLQELLAKKVSLFFESGSTVAYVAQIVGKQLNEQQTKIQISTNNVLAYLILWLVHRIRCSLFPWGPPEQRYGAVFGIVNNMVPESKQPSFPPERLSRIDEAAIKLLIDDHFSPARWNRPTLMLGALSGLQLTSDPKISNCLGPHVGSPRNKVFKRFMYATTHPVMLFLTTDKIDRAVDPEHCHFILDQEQDQGLGWEFFCRELPIAFCVGCKNVQEEIKQTVARFEALGFIPIPAQHKTPYTAFIVRNKKFIDDLESGMNIR